MIILHFITFLFIFSNCGDIYFSRYTALLVARTFITERSCKSSISTTHHLIFFIFDFFPSYYFPTYYLRSSFAPSYTFTFDFFLLLGNVLQTKIVRFRCLPPFTSFMLHLSSLRIQKLIL